MQFYDWGNEIPNIPKTLKIYDGNKYWCTENYNMFVAVGNSGKIGYSNDGITWTLSNTTAFGTSTIRAIVYGYGKFVAVGSDGKIGYSIDGKTWTLSSTTAFGTTAIYGMTYG
jgi:hypothetical protein